MLEIFKKYNKYLSIVFITIIYLVGVINLVLGNLSLLALTPINLLLSTSLLLIANGSSLKNYIGLIIFIFIAGFFVEVAGVKTGLIFGNYYYGNNLGFKLFNVPIILGINWVLTVFCSTCLAQYLVPKAKPYIIIISAAIFMVVLDLLIEPVAPKLDFWYWQNDHPPLKNFIAWFILGIIFQILVHKFVRLSNIHFGVWLYVLQIIFFVTANISLWNTLSTH